MVLSETVAYDHALTDLEAKHFGMSGILSHDESCTAGDGASAGQKKSGHDKTSRFRWFFDIMAYTR